MLAKLSLRRTTPRKKKRRAELMAANLPKHLQVASYNRLQSRMKEILLDMVPSRRTKVRRVRRTPVVQLPRPVDSTSQCSSDSPA